MKGGVFYLVWAENIVKPILEGQVVEILESVTDFDCSRLRIVSFYPIHNLILHRRALSALRRRLRKSHIALTVIPIVTIPPRWNLITLRWPFLFLARALAAPWLSVLAVVFRPDVLHVRSYPAMPAALDVKRLVPGTRVIFDVRSDFPEENVTAGSWKLGSKSYFAWKRLERRALERSDCTAMIGEVYDRHYRALVPAIRSIIVPNNVNCNRFAPDPGTRRTMRDRLGFAQGDVVFVYCGSLDNSWHKPSLYLDFIQNMDAREYRFLFVTGNVELMRRELSDHPSLDERAIVRAAPFAEVPKYLQAADIAMVFLDRPKIATAIKTSEYLASGLPVVTNRYLEGAASLIEAHPEVGAVLEETEAIDADEVARLRGPDVRHAAVALARKRFDTRAVARTYLDAYRELAE